MVGVMFGRRDQLDRKRVDIDRNVRERTQFEPAPALVLGVVTGATQIGAANAYRWTYSVDEAWMSGTGVVARTNGMQGMTAYSVSELSNTGPGGTFSYGVQGANLPAGWVPVRIPNGTAVILSAHRRADGSLVWLIINTQAIDGVCAS